MLNRVLTLTICLWLSSFLVRAEEKTRPRWRTALHQTSVVVLTAANAIDVGSSWGARESTPFLRSSDGRFGARGATIKVGMLAGILATEVAVMRKQPKGDIAATALNLSFAAAMSKIAANNIAIRRASH